MTPERQVRARSWRALKIRMYLPTFTEDQAWVWYDVRFYSCLSLTFVESCSMCAEALPGQDCRSLTTYGKLVIALRWNHVLEQKSDACVVTSSVTALLPLVHPSSEFSHKWTLPWFFITLLALIRWPLCHFPSGTPSSTICFCMAYFILLPFCQKDSKIHLDP